MLPQIVRFGKYFFRVFIEFSDCSVSGLSYPAQPFERQENKHKKMRQAFL